ncbi:MAG TPA: RNA polymerase-binding protein RbpA [Candidatus Limnocylindria bacterium]|nr:RNA polymerase-binding protein RbpA [Candidatus Limnocylindria bacterium]
MTAVRGYGMSTRSYESDVNVVGVPSHPEVYHCPTGHVLTLNFAADADEIPQTWDCPKCGRTAHRDETAARRASVTEGDLSVPTMSPRTMVASKTPWDMLLERRSLVELEELLKERLAHFRNR